VKLSEIKRHLAELELRPSRSLGQNFLHDQNLAAWIVAQLGLSPADHVVEIGPGLGALTEFALLQCASATLIEKDSRLVNLLRRRFAANNVEIVHGDAAEFCVRELFPRGEVKVLGNLPYYVSSQILFRFTDEPSPVTRMVLTLQRELAERLSAGPSTKDYGALTLIIGRRWHVKYLRSLPPDVFTPHPKVDSGAVLLALREPDELPECDGALFNELVKRGFSQRRKQLRNLLADVLPLPWPSFAARLGVSESVRAEELNLRQWIKLTNLVRPVEDALAQNVHEEIFDVVDDRDQVVGAASRHDIHKNKLLHRAVHVFVFNRAGELFLQRRSRWKDVHPLKWDSSAAGHVESGDDHDSTATRELIEELGIEAAVELVAKIPASERTGHEFVHLYRAEHDGPFRIARSEIECGGFFPIELIARWTAARPQDFATGFLECFGRLNTAEA
jgi:16S rRNA (adenine1518-N6/adenine1519-N6)-dimethyltransferase